MAKSPEERADELFEAALALYLESLALDRQQPSALYNIGLIYKSLASNRAATNGNAQRVVGPVRSIA